MKVWMPEATSVTLKLEGGDAVPAATGDLIAQYTTPGQWQELTFDLSSAVEGARYTGLTLIPNGGQIPMTDRTYYYDDITVGGGSCGSTTGLFSVPSVGVLRAFPNPVADRLTIDNPGDAVRLSLTNMVGRRVREWPVDPQSGRLYHDVTLLPAGTYLLTAESAAGHTIARSLIVKR